MEEVIMYGSAKSDKTSTAELEKQFRIAKEYSDLYGMKISAVYFDISNSDRVDQRHGLQEILALAAAGEARTIVVSDLAKISTNIAQVAYWLEKLNRTNTRLISRKGSAMMCAPQTIWRCTIASAVLPRKSRKRKRKTNIYQKEAHLLNQ